jgi:hypothetical protein
MMNRLHISSSITPSPVHVQHPVTPCDYFLSQFNPATASIHLLWTERLQQVPFKSVCAANQSISIDVRRCYQQMMEHAAGSMCFFPAITEMILNAIGQPRCLPLIVETGASCCITPCKDDFIANSYKTSEVRIKDLSGTNTVAGEGMLSWKVLDRFRHEVEIKIKGYHVSQASVCLPSPQSFYRAIDGHRCR